MERIIKLVVLDIDGVLTDGKVYIDDEARETKTICYKDLDYMSLLKKEGVSVIAITGESGGIVNIYKARFPWDDFIEGCKEKGKRLEEISKEYNVPLSQICYIGDGYHDLSALKKAGMSVCPADATMQAKLTADFVLEERGGCGCVEALYELLMKKSSSVKADNSVEIEKDINDGLEELLIRYPMLEEVRKSIFDAFIIMRDCYMHKNKILIAGNGGSASDAEHIVGELMKSFRLRRPLDKKLTDQLIAVGGNRGNRISDLLEQPLEAIALVGHESLSTAFLNDVEGKMVMAQQLLGYGKEKDVLIAISTSGNSENILNTAILAKALGMKVIALTGRGGGLLKEYADCSVMVPETETYRVQELHLPIYHWWCMWLERFFFKPKTIN